MDSEARKKRLETLSKKFQKKYDIEVSDFENPTEIKVISTGSMLLDKATGIGGFPKGRLTEIFGIESSGKSTLAMKSAVNCQEEGYPVLYLDFEHTFSENYAQNIGLNIDRESLIHWMPDTLEQGMTILKNYLEENVIGMAIIDSVAAMIPTSEAEAEIGKVFVAAGPRAFTNALRVLIPIIHKSAVVVLLVNHVKQVISATPTWGAPKETTPGGKALDFLSSVRVQLTPIKNIKGKVVDLVTGEMVDGNVAKKVRAKCIKNKVGIPWKEGFFYLSPDVGIDEDICLLEVAIARRIIKKTGPMYEFENIKVRGQVEFIKSIKDDENVYLILKESVINALNSDFVTIVEDNDLDDVESFNNEEEDIL